MKRNLIILALIAVVSLVAGTIIYYAAGIGKNEEVKLSGRISVVADGGSYNAVSEAAEAFKELHPRVQIEVKQESDSAAAASEEIKAGSLGEDVFVVPEKGTAALLKDSRDSFMDLTQYVEAMGDAYPNGVLAGLSSAKNIYGIPWTTEPMIVLYRSDVFSVEGVDVSDIKTWDDFRRMGVSVSESTGKKFLIYNTNDFDRLRATMLSQLRINYSDLDSYSRVAELINGMVADKTLQASTSVTTTLKQGKALAAIVNPSDAVKIMNGATSLQGKWSAMKLPAFEPGGNRDVSLGGYNLMISRNTRNSDLAREFSKYLSSDVETAAGDLKQYGSFSASYNIYSDDSFAFSAEYFGMDIWSLFADVAEGAPQNVYQ